MPNLKEMERKIENAVVEGFQKIENGVVDRYKKIEDSVVEGWRKIPDKFVDLFLTCKGKKVKEAKKHGVE